MEEDEGGGGVGDGREGREGGRKGGEPGGGVSGSQDSGGAEQFRKKT